MQSASTDSFDVDDISDSNDSFGGNTPVGTIESPLDKASGCTNCGWESYSSDTYCKRCGYYAVLGRCIELEDWERETGKDDNPESNKSTQSTWMQIPIWAWQIAAAVTGVSGLSVAGRCMTLADSTQRITWSLSELGVGMAALILAHAFITKTAISQNVSLQLGDAITSPIRIWIEACVDFQRSSRWIVVGIAGLWAVILTHALLGVPYGRMFTHEEAPPKKESAGDASSPSRPGNGDRQMTMEEAMKEFSEKSGADKMAENAGQLGQPINSKDSPEKSPEIRTLECLIIGYQTGTEQSSTVSSIVVATQMEGRWAVVGTVSDGLTAEIQQELIGKAASLHRAQPFVACSYQAVWIEPVLNCRVEAKYASDESQPPKLTFMNLK